jgi:hypothetical protein
MILSRPLQGAVRGVGRNALDLPVAGLAGIAVAVVAFAMPGDILDELVGATGLPSVLAAAQAPLGFTARAILGLGGGLAAFALVFMLLRLLDRSGFEPGATVEPRPGVQPGESFAAEPEALPRLRRRDLHPDAPARRPISATRDLGEPAPPPDPLWLQQASPIEAQEPAEVPIAAISEPQPQPQSQPEPEPQPEPDLAFESRPKSPPEPVGLDTLMERLEQGLALRRTRQLFAQPQPAAGPAARPEPPQIFPEAGDDRLQNAIESLQRLAARQG